MSGVLHDEAPFSVGYRAAESLGEAARPNAGTLSGLESDPPALEPAACVVGQCHITLLPVIGKKPVAGKYPRLDEGLEAVADADHGFALGDEFPHLVLEEGSDVEGEEPAGAEGVRVGETAWDDEYLASGQKAPIRPELVHMDDPGFGAGQLEGIGRVGIPVDAGGMKYERPGFHIPPPISAPSPGRSPRAPIPSLAKAFSRAGIPTARALPSLRTIVMD